MASSTVSSIADRVTAVGRRGIVTIMAVAGLIVASIEPLHACMICIPVPEKTVADYLIESDIAVLAREDQARPFFYEPVEILKGAGDGAPIEPVEILKGIDDGAPIDLFMDSATRRRLASAPARAVVLVHGGAGRGWRSLGYADADYEEVIRHIIDHAAGWQTADHPDRLEYFAGLLGHDNQILAELAYLEVGRAPYGKIKALSNRVRPEQIRRYLTDMAYYDWRPLAILMLAHVGNGQDRQHISRSFDLAEKHQIVGNLAAWATAYIEIEGADAIDRIENRYFRGSDRTRAELTEITKALSVHGSEGHVELRDRIVDAYAVLLENHPSMVGYVARDLAAWQHWRLTEQIRAIADDHPGLDHPTLFAIGYYLGLAAEGDRNGKATAAAR
jgi:hypothetical protein